MRKAPLFQRHPKNPLLRPEDAPVSCTSICNPAATLCGDDVLLLTRIIDAQGHSQLWVARSKNGIDNWRFDPDPLLAPPPEGEWYDSLGCEDPRITYLEERQEYAVIYIGYSHFGAGVSLGLTKDFKSIDKKGLIIPPYDKDAVLFPRKIGDRYIIVHRPSINGLENIWIMESNDLVHWGVPKCVLQKDTNEWDRGKIGAGPPPIETPDGWILIYHGAENTDDGWVYRVGIALLELENPSNVLARTLHPVLVPEMPYERGGSKPGIVFPTGLIRRGDDVNIYYGADDTCVCMASTTVPQILETLAACKSTKA